MKRNNRTKTESATPTLIRFDWAMKRLLRQKANFTVLEGFLSVLLNEEVKIGSIRESEGNQEHPEDKFNRVDIFVENTHGELLIIEMQNSEQVDYFLRMLYGASKAVTEHISKGDPYSKVRKVYHINIVYFELGQGKDYVYVGSNEFRGLHYGDVLQLTKDQKTFFKRENRKNVRDVKDLFPYYYLLCVKNFDVAAENSLDEWMYYLKNNAIPDNFTAPGLDEARKRLRYDNLSDEEKRNYDNHLEETRNIRSSIDTAVFKGELIGLEKGEAIGLEKGEAIGLEKGEAIGERKKALNIARNLLSKGMSVHDVCDVTGLSEEQIISDT